MSMISSPCCAGNIMDKISDKTTLGVKLISNFYDVIKIKTMLFFFKREFAVFCMVLIFFFSGSKIGDVYLF